VVSSIARFTHLPEQHTLTVRVDIPEPWNVQALLASQDIDNLRCSPSSCGEMMMIVMIVMIVMMWWCDDDGSDGGRPPYYLPSPPSLPPHVLRSIDRCTLSNTYPCRHHTYSIILVVIIILYLPMMWLMIRWRNTFSSRPVCIIISQSS